MDLVGHLTRDEGGAGTFHMDFCSDLRSGIMYDNLIARELHIESSCTNE